MRTRHLAAVVAVLALTACSDGDAGEVADAGRTAVGDVALAVPDGWERIDEDADAPLVTNTRFVDPDRRLRLVQVIVGCDERGLGTLVGSVGQPRGQLVVTAARERTEPPEVDGLEQVRRLTLDLGSGAEDTDPDFVIEALYGQRGAALVLVELNVPAAGDPVDADEVLGSVTVDGDALEASCEG
jgi:hypothetical protein